MQEEQEIRLLLVQHRVLLVEMLVNLNQQDKLVVAVVLQL
tara:strand:- start:98 stop:217 length:120 start_codon:yes stop_codon:yes gene_type:complete